MIAKDAICFYTICNSNYFTGLIALINSLELAGHSNPIVIGDCGLTMAQRDLLLGYDRCRLFRLDRSLVHNPTQFKAFAHLAGVHEIAILIDSDIIVTANLAYVVDEARSGKICAFPNPDDRRWFAEWKEIFGLAAEPRRQTYVCAGFVAFSVKHFPNLLAQWWEACRRISSHPTVQESGDLHGPTSQADQDALNAVLMTEYPTEALSLLPLNLQPGRQEFPYIKIVNYQTLACEIFGERCVMLHAALSPKPWVRKGVIRDVCFLFLLRLLLWPDVEVTMPVTMLDGFLSPGMAGVFERYSLYLENMGLVPFVLSFLPNALRARLRTLKRRLRSSGRTLEPSAARH